MKQLLCVLAVVCCAASTATAGPNQGGVIWVHDTGIVFTTDLTLPPVSESPADCAAVDNRQETGDGSISTIWKVYAAFPAGSHPRLKAVGWSIEYPEAATSPASYVNVSDGGPPKTDGETDDFFIMSPDPLWPATGSSIAQSFITIKLTLVTPLWWFYGFGYGAPPPTWCTVPHPAAANRFFVDDATPEANTDPIMGYGCLGFGTPGSTPCPTSDPDAACCALAGTCTLTKQAACLSPDVWHGEWYACDPNLCPIPTGACCYTDGRCQVPTQLQCSQGGGVYQGDFTPCTPNPCPVASACCTATGVCLVRTQSACAALNPPGTWHPESVSCDPNPCEALPTGSCCFPNGSCLVQAEAACTGIWTLSGSCQPNLCPAPEVEAACCTPQATCTLTLRDACAAPNEWHAEWDTCDPNPCQQLLRACCSPDGGCTLTTELICDLASTWHSELTSCSPNLCPLLPTESTSWGQIKNRYR